VKAKESFCESTYTDQAQMAEHELFAFMSAVNELFGPEQARLSATDWLDESELIDGPPRSTPREWRSVTVAAVARLANRLKLAVHDKVTRIVRLGVSVATSGDVCDQAKVADAAR
jgi:hypothetical protein